MPRKVHIGAPFVEFPGGSFNELVDDWFARRAERNAHTLPSAQPSLSEVLAVTIKNSSGADRTIGQALGIGGPLHSYSQNRQVLYRGPAFDSGSTVGSNYVIARVNIANGAIRHYGGVLAGPCWARVNVSDSTHTHAKRDGSEHLISGTDGEPIVWREGGTGLQWTFIVKGLGGGGGADNEVVVALIDDDINGATEDKGKKQTNTDPAGKSLSLWAAEPKSVTLKYFRAAQADRLMHKGSGTCRGGSANKIILAADAVAVENYYKDAKITLSNGDAQTITAYAAAAREATVNANWPSGSPKKDETKYTITKDDPGYQAGKTKFILATKETETAPGPPPTYKTEYETKSFYYLDAKKFSVGEYTRGEYQAAHDDLGENDPWPPAGSPAGFWKRRYRAQAKPDSASRLWLDFATCEVVPPPAKGDMT